MFRYSKYFQIGVFEIRAETSTDICVQYPLFLSHSRRSWNLSADFIKNFSVSVFVELAFSISLLFHTYG
jgi:hypothetical protein